MLSATSLPTILIHACIKEEFVGIKYALLFRGVNLYRYYNKLIVAHLQPRYMHVSRWEMGTCADVVSLLF